MAHAKWCCSSGVSRGILEFGRTKKGAWDEHVKRVLHNGSSATARRLLLISVVRPVW